MSEQDPRLVAACEVIINSIGDDPTREGLERSPERMARALREMTSGYRETLEGICEGALFKDPNSEMVTVRDVDFYSLCEHHLLPFFGRVHVAYIPNGRIIGLSKIPRVVEMFARRLQVQERLTHQIAKGLGDVLAPKGLGCVVEGYHLCTMARGVRRSSARLVTSAFSGKFSEDASLRAELLQLVRPASTGPTL